MDLVTLWPLFRPDFPWRKGGEDLIVLCNYPKEGCGEVGADLFSQVTSSRTKGNGLNFCQGKLGLGIRENFFMKRVVKHWKRLPREVVKSPSLGVDM